MLTNRVIMTLFRLMAKSQKRKQIQTLINNMNKMQIMTVTILIDRFILITYNYQLYT